MKRALLFALLLAASSGAHAVKLGANVGLTDGDAEIDNSFSDDVDIETTEFGFTLDTRRPNRVFAYRLHANLVDGEIDSFVNARGLNVTNTFGFQLNGASNSSVAVWLGPSISLGRLDVEFESQFGDASDDGTFFSVGPTVGVDVISRTGTPTFAFELGYRLGVLVFDDDTFEDLDTSEFLIRAGVLFGQ